MGAIMNEACTSLIWEWKGGSAQGNYNEPVLHTAVPYSYLSKIATVLSSFMHVQLVGSLIPIHGCLYTCMSGDIHSYQHPYVNY